MFKKMALVTLVALFAMGISTVFLKEEPAQAQCSIEQRRGCCSHHGGVCGCRSGRAVCCDGSLSPSCGCD